MPSETNKPPVSDTTVPNDLTTSAGDIFAWVKTKHCGILLLRQALNGPHVVIQTHIEEEEGSWGKPGPNSAQLPFSQSEVAEIIAALVRGMAYDAHEVE